MRGVLWVGLSFINIHNLIFSETGFPGLAISLQIFFLLGLTVDVIRIVFWENQNIEFAKDYLNIPGTFGLRRHEIPFESIRYIKIKESHVFVYREKSHAFFQNFSVIWLNDYSHSTLLKEEFGSLSNLINAREGFSPG